MANIITHHKPWSITKLLFPLGLLCCLFHFFKCFTPSTIEHHHHRYTIISSHHTTTASSGFQHHQLIITFEHAEHAHGFNLEIDNIMEFTWNMVGRKTERARNTFRWRLGVIETLEWPCTHTLVWCS
ncbi:hypothetical protein DE146DRAFT_432587 [Phaeosphaeria sp. MPI-PUGE-AT-0046c]|nr:hypothetical protein DE146DRAFT_432587 [Phaeosphaeria sp. MPI-PUGE-AT-0046c]